MKKKPQPQPEPDLSRKIREAEFKNILQKLKDGKTLSAREAKMAEEFAKERQPKQEGPISQVALAKAWGMTQPNISYLCKQGMPLTSIEAASEWRKDYLEKQGKGDQAPASLNDARLRKILLECERIELTNAISKGEYVGIGAVRETGIRIGSVKPILAHLGKCLFVNIIILNLEGVLCFPNIGDSVRRVCDNHISKPPPHKHFR